MTSDVAQNVALERPASVVAGQPAVRGGGSPEHDPDWVSQCASGASTAPATGAGRLPLATVTTEGLSGGSDGSTRNALTTSASSVGVRAKMTTVELPV